MDRSGEIRPNHHHLHHTHIVINSQWAEERLNYAVSRLELQEYGKAIVFIIVSSICHLYTTDCQDEVLVMRAHGSLHMHQCSYNSQGYTGRATHLFNLPSHPGSLHSDPTGVQVGHNQFD